MNKQIIEVIVNVTKYLLDNPLVICDKFQWEYQELENKSLIILNYYVAGSEIKDVYTIYPFDEKDIDIISNFFIKNYNMLVREL